MSQPIFVEHLWFRILKICSIHNIYIYSHYRVVLR